MNKVVLENFKMDNLEKAGKIVIEAREFNQIRSFDIRNSGKG